MFYIVDYRAKIKKKKERKAYRSSFLGINRAFTSTLFIFIDAE